jgi:ATP-dependent DNA ligase
MKIELYKHTPHGIRYWSVEADYDGACIEIEHGLYEGALQWKTEDVMENNSGRSLDEQIDHRMAARVAGKKDIGYRESIQEAKQVNGDNMLGFKHPMLAHRHDRMKDIDYDNAYLQMKYNGHRCLVTMTNSGLIAYSRKGRRITTIDHILNGIKLPIGCTIDGELYCHSTPLQRISSWAKRKQPDTLKLEYMVYDTISNKGYRDRYNELIKMELGRSARVAPTDKSVSKRTLSHQLESAISFGFEGLIIRQLNMPYAVGKRSKSLIKVKQFIDDEFLVVGIKPSSDGWAILTCDAKNGETFDVSAPGTMQEKLRVIRNREQYLGRMVSVSYAELTISGKPFHPTANNWKVEL